MRKKEIAKVVSQECIGTGIYSMVIKTEAAKEAAAGQFISVYCKDSAKLLPRPISICQINKQQSTIRIVYRVVGGGTEEMSAYRAGDEIALIGPLGNGFTVREGKKAILIGGGIGIPPMVGLAETLNTIALKNELEPQQYVQIVAGYRDELFLTEELKNNGTLCRIYFLNQCNYNYCKNIVRPVFVQECQSSADKSYCSGGRVNHDSKRTFS